MQIVPLKDSFQMKQFSECLHPFMTFITFAMLLQHLRTNFEI